MSKYFILKGIDPLISKKRNDHFNDVVISRCFRKSPLNFKGMILIVFFFYLFQFESVYAQNEIKRIVPLSPNAASFTKYGEMPVSYFTGIPNITIPLYTAKSGELELPLSLSYHAGGHKVESIASWVGLGWSLGGIPMITRSVNGLEDEGLGGIFSLYNGLTLRQINDQKENGNAGNYKNLMLLVKENQMDTEPDVFSYSINGQSGRFYYSQDLQKFLTIPRSNIKIEYNGGFLITAEDGTRYFFNDKETTRISSGETGSPITSCWQISKIEDVNQTENILFQYELETISTRTFKGSVKYQFVSGNMCPNMPEGADNQPMITEIQSKVLSRIVFKNGYISFVKDNLEREDLVGGHSLKEVKIYKGSDDLLKTFRFNYHFNSGGGSGPGCVIDDVYKSNKWMLLSSMAEIGAQGDQLPAHQFFYNEAYFPPCRNSFAQDYWGYHNGAYGNVELIPTVTIPGTNIQVPGANREVKPSYAQFGILNQIIYPTGGRTEFEYKNNDTSEENAPRKYTWGSAYVAGEGEENLPPYKEYESFFEINNPPDAFLNNGNSKGGAFINVDVGALGVEPGSRGAWTNLEGISPDNRYLNITFSYGFKNYYIPNGKYRIRAIFNQDPPNYHDFHYIVDWKKIDSTATNSYVGGLRVERISTYEGGNTISGVTTYKYTSAYDSKASSGDIFGKDDYKYSTLIQKQVGEYIGGIPVNCSAEFLRLSSYSNQSQVSQSGSYIGYKKVYVTSERPDQTGVTSYDYTFTRDVDQNGFPYPPRQSMESFRGQLKLKEEFKFVGEDLKLVKKTKFTYLNKVYDDNTVFGFKVSRNTADPAYNVPGPAYFIPYALSYELPPTWSSELSKIETLYNSDNNNAVESITSNEYENTYNLLEISKTTRSDQKETTIKNFYPHNLTQSGQAEIARQWLSSKGSINTLLKQEKYSNSNLVSTKTIDYKNFDGQNLVKPYQITQSDGANSDPRIILFDHYDKYGNVIQQHQSSAPPTSYLWSYNGQYPAVEIKNASYIAIENILGANAISNFQRQNPTYTEIASFIAPLKTQLPEAFVTIYTYKPLVGMTSQTDAKGMTIYYEYDEFQRLKNIKDQEGNIIKNTTYHYKP
ncbi:hypothetical protein [Pedobacter nutrimenti]|uniref:YD repeat-containing protein n=1 Tax=Pedobacter nutrimenti TaxID=1241337 RepID=A0A318UFE4_9SPHI|nr:hypothetical protein [Pedobacter nutrimenti]PYF74200.1 hypothetical protein B0O44_104371 [Pedobacter nutrimenti]